MEEQPLPIISGIHGMDLAPANICLSTAQMQLVSASMRDFRLKEAIEPIESDYVQFYLNRLPSQLRAAFLHLPCSRNLCSRAP